MQRTWKQSHSHYTTYDYTQKAPLPKITRSYRGGGAAALSASPGSASAHNNTVPATASVTT